MEYRSAILAWLMQLFSSAIFINLTFSSKVNSLYGFFFRFVVDSLGSPVVGEAADSGEFWPEHGVEPISGEGIGTLMATFVVIAVPGSEVRG